MSKHSKLSIVESEGIDAIVDSVAADPAFAAQAKTILREKVKAQRSVSRFPTAAMAANDDEDMWDNMPI